MLDKSLIGSESKLSTFTVEKGHIQKFAAAVGATKPEYLAGFVAPPTFITTLGFVDQDSKDSIMAPLNLDPSRILHGEQEYEYFEPVLAGDELVYKTTITDIFEKAGKAGVMDFVVSETIILNQDGIKVAIGRGTTVQRPG